MFGVGVGGSYSIGDHPADALALRVVHDRVARVLAGLASVTRVALS